MRRFAILPLACYAVMLAYACYAAAVVGHWPFYAHPDPKELPVRTLLHIVAIVMLIGALSVLLLPVSYTIWRSAMKLKDRTVPKHRTWVLLYAAGGIIWLLDFAAVHGRLPWRSLIDWIID
jgi:hypothetical protein